MGIYYIFNEYALQHHLQSTKIISVQINLMQWNYCDSKIGLFIRVKLLLLIFLASFWYQFFPSFLDCFLSKVITFPIITIAIVIALNFLCFIFKLVLSFFSWLIFLYSYHSSNYQNCNSCRYFSLLEISFHSPLVITFKSKKERAIQKKTMDKCIKLDKKRKEIAIGKNE